MLVAHEHPAIMFPPRICTAAALAMLLLLASPAASESVDGTSPSSRFCEKSNWFEMTMPGEAVRCREALDRQAAHPGAAAASSLAACVDACREQGPLACAGTASPLDWP